MQKPDLSTPETVERAFYQALEGADLDSMMSVWDASDNIVCVHPLGPPRVGQDQIRESWRQIFAAGTRLRFHISLVVDRPRGDTVLRIVYETITVLGTDEQPSQPLIATNAYRRGPDGWRLILHHASPAPPLADERSGRLH